MLDAFGEAEPERRAQAPVEASVCPHVEQLERMLLGLVSDDEFAELEQHVTHCAKCMAALAGAAAGDSLVRAVHDHTRRLSSLRARRASIEAVVERAKRIVGEVGPSTSHLAASAADIAFLSPAEQPDEVGRLGDYRILRVLGSGGMGVVFEAEEIQLGRRVALKAMKPVLAASASSHRRFIREAQAAASVEHEQIVPVYHVGSDRGIPFIIMPLLRGEPLAARLDAQAPAPLPLAQALRIGREIALGLAAAHQAGLIHRDIKPGNVWLEAGTDSATILDFGLARATTDGAQITHAGTLLGTPAYMAPEQARGVAVDARADLFSLGCVLYHITTGVQPFSSESTLAALLSVALSEPTPPRELNRDLPAALSELI